MARFLREMRDFARYFFLPMLVAVLPRRAGAAFASAIARRPWFYEDEAHTSLAAARRFIAIGDEQRWMHEYCLIRFTDDVDLYQSILRNDRWMSRHLTIEGAWPQDKSFVAITFHWGGGIWALRSLRQAGVTISGLALSVDRAAFHNRAVRYWYARLRNWQTARVIGGGLNFTGNAVRRLIEALRSGLSICGLFDVPPQPAEKCLSGRLLGHAAHFPRGLARIAVIEAKPVVVFFSSVDSQTGKQQLWIDPPLRFDDETRLGQHLISRLQAAVELRPAAWHHWAAMDAFVAAQTNPESMADRPLAA
jgi:phosphatidylinositol dimannoside acyltransferase